MFSTHVFFFTTRFHTRTRFTFPIPPLPPQIRPPVSPALLDLAVLLPHGGGEGRDMPCPVEMERSRDFSFTRL